MVKWYIQKKKKKHGATRFSHRRTPHRGADFSWRACFFSRLRWAPWRERPGAAIHQWNSVIYIPPELICSWYQYNPPKKSTSLGILIWVCLKMLVSTPVYPMVLLIIIPMKNCYFIGNINPTFSVTNPFPGWTNETMKQDSASCIGTSLVLGVVESGGSNV